MTRYGWDASNHDWPRGPMDLALAKQQGISLFTHKSSEGSTYTDPNFDEAMTRAQAAGFPVVGAYHVLWPNNPAAQADFWISVVNQYAPWWRQHPCWIWQIDAELFQEFNPFRQPTVSEINQCGDRIVAQTGVKPSQVVVYAPEWLYGSGLSGLKYRCLWASNYTSGSGGFKTLYPGDTSTRWHAYSGITPTILQYTSTATIAGQSPADANAIRVNSDAELQALFLGGDDMSQADIDAINANTNQQLQLLWKALGGQENSVFSGGTNIQDAVNAIKTQLDYLQKWIGGTDNSVYSGGVTAADLQTAVNALAQQMAALQSAVAAMNPASGGPVSGAVTGTLTITPQA